MRWALVKVCLAVTVMVVVAFAIPLALVVKETARDRAFANAERQASAIGPALAITTDRRELQRAVAITQAGAHGRVAVHVPATRGEDRRGKGHDELRVGRSRAPHERLTTAQRRGRASTVSVEGGFALLRPTAVAGGKVAVVEIFVPDTEVTNGVGTSWGCSPPSGSR